MLSSRGTRFFSALGTTHPNAGASAGISCPISIPRRVFSIHLNHIHCQVDERLCICSNTDSKRRWGMIPNPGALCLNAWHSKTIFHAYLMDLSLQFSRNIFGLEGSRPANILHEAGRRNSESRCQRDYSSLRFVVLSEDPEGSYPASVTPAPCGIHCPLLVCVGTAYLFFIANRQTTHTHKLKSTWIWKQCVK